MTSRNNHERHGTPAQGARLWLCVAFVAATVAGVAGAFAWTAGWISLESASRLTSERMIDGFEGMTGQHPGFRRNHAKGICVSGYFDSNGQAAGLSKASVFKRADTR
jgi:catalase